MPFTKALFSDLKISEVCGGFCWKRNSFIHLLATCEKFTRALLAHHIFFDFSSNKGQCSLEIEKPLRPEDIGIWRIYFDAGINEINYIGCVFDVKDTTSRLRTASRTKRSNRESKELRSLRFHSSSLLLIISRSQHDRNPRRPNHHHNHHL
jgi:hypothetical protein